MSLSLNNEELTVLDQAFHTACVELGLGANADDNARRERLSQLIVSVASEGERDPTTLARRAFELMKTNE
jgi:hypothetical protein